MNVKRFQRLECGGVEEAGCNRTAARVNFAIFLSVIFLSESGLQSYLTDGVVIPRMGGLSSGVHLPARGDQASNLWGSGTEIAEREHIAKAAGCRFYAGRRPRPIPVNWTPGMGPKLALIRANRGGRVVYRFSRSCVSFPDNVIPGDSGREAIPAGRSDAYNFRTRKLSDGDRRATMARQEARTRRAFKLCVFLSQVSISLESSGNSLRRSPIALSTLAR